MSRRKAFQIYGVTVDGWLIVKMLIVVCLVWNIVLVAKLFDATPEAYRMDIEYTDGTTEVATVESVYKPYLNGHGCVKASDGQGRCGIRKATIKKQQR